MPRALTAIAVLALSLAACAGREASSSSDSGAPARGATLDGRQAMGAPGDQPSGLGESGATPTAPAPGERASRSVHIVGAPEAVHIAGAKRFAVRATVPLGLTRDELRGLLAAAAEREARRLGADALMLFAYREGENPTGIYTAGRAVVAPGGDWSRARERGTAPQTTVELEERYFAPPDELQAGASGVLMSAGASGEVALSRSAQSWHDEDIVAHLPAGARVTVVEVWRDAYLTRYRVRGRTRERMVTGWVHKDALAPASR